MDKHNKILELFYSNESANDLLAFELIKQVDKSNEFYYPLIYLIVQSKNSDLKEDIIEFLSPNLQPQHKEFIETMSVAGLMAWFYFYKKDGNTGFENKKFTDFISVDEMLELCYFLIRRSNFGFDYFFQLDEGNDSRRSEIINLCLNKIEKRELTIHFFSLKEIEYVFDYLSSKFSDFSKLTFHVKDENTFPKDWSKLKRTNTIRIVGDENCVFSNFDFLNTVSDLKDVNISKVKLSEPDVFIREYKFRIKIQYFEFEDDKFNHLVPFEFYEQVLLENRPLNYGRFLFVIKKSNLRFEEKRKLLYEKMLQPIHTSRLTMFSLEELMVLKDTDNPRAKSMIQLDIDFRI